MTSLTSLCSLFLLFFVFILSSMQCHYPQPLSRHFAKLRQNETEGKTQATPEIITTLIIERCY